jgi:hypothetical protein
MDRHMRLVVPEIDCGRGCDLGSGAGDEDDLAGKIGDAGVGLGRGYGWNSGMSLEGRGQR